MQVKIFSAFDAADARRMLKLWRQEHPKAQIVRETATAPVEAHGRYDGKRLFQIAIEYEGREGGGG